MITNVENYRSSRPEVFCKKCFLKTFSKFTENTFARVSLLITLQASALQLELKRDSGVGLFFSAFSIKQLWVLLLELHKNIYFHD